LSYVRGVTVAVNVELEKELRKRQTEVKPDQKGVVAKRTEKSRSRTHDGAAPGGRAGFQANQPQALAGGTGKGAHEEEEESTQTEDMALGSMSVEKETAGLTPTLVTASIGVPTSHFEAVWRQHNPPQPGEAAKTPTQADLDQVRTQEIAKIKSAVTGLLPPPDKTTDVTQLVTVNEFQDIAPEPVPVPGMPEKTLDWLVRNWSVLGLTFLGMFSLVVLRSVARSVPASPARSKAVAAGTAGAATALSPQTSEPVETPAERRLRRFAAGGPSLRDELSEMVSEDPDAAANILRTWIGSLK
jgi:flagellar M-ring protein FliF